MFWIQASAPRFIPHSGRRMGDLAAAIEEIFLDDTEDAVVFWNRIPAVLNYKYDVSTIISDVLEMLTAIMHNPQGEHIVGWGSNSFRGEWRLAWRAESVTIDARWDAVSGNYQHLLNSVDAITLRVDEYVSEWKTLLWTVQNAVSHSGVELLDETELAKLREIEQAIPAPGRLYRV